VTTKIEKRGHPFYHCFGCGSDGSVIDFVMRTQGMEYPQAVEYLRRMSRLRGRIANALEPSEHLEHQKRGQSELFRVIRSYMTLHYRGRGGFSGVCPRQHGDNQREFTVNERHGYFHCFGCRWHGDEVKFVMAMEEIDFGEARCFIREQRYLLRRIARGSK